MKRLHWLKLLLEVITMSLATIFFGLMLINFIVGMTRAYDPDYSIYQQINLP